MQNLSTNYYPYIFCLKNTYFCVYSPPPLPLDSGPLSIKIITKQIKQYHFSLEDEVLNKIVWQ